MGLAMTEKGEASWDLDVPTAVITIWTSNPPGKCGRKKAQLRRVGTDPWEVWEPAVRVDRISQRLVGWEEPQAFTLQDTRVLTSYHTCHNPTQLSASTLRSRTKFLFTDGQKQSLHCFSNLTG